MRRIVFNAPRTAYSVDQLREYEVVTVEEMMKFLEQFDADDGIVLSHDRGYTYGSLDTDEIQVFEKLDEPDEDGNEWQAVEEVTLFDC